MENNKFRISDKKLQLLNLLLKEEGIPETVSLSRITQAVPADYYPLSFAQQRLWFLDQLAPGSPFYNFSFPIPFNVAIDIPLLQKSLDEIERRHSSLRTVFNSVDGQPKQFIVDGFFEPLQYVDIRTSSPEEQQLEILRLIQLESQRSFDLGKGPLFRYLLIQTSPNGFVFTLTIHHIISDTWSLEVFWHELQQLYNAFWLGKSSPLPELPIQYHDFAVWQREWLKGDVIEKQLNYWKLQLADLPDLLLYTDFVRPSVLSYSGAYQQVNIPGSLIQQLKVLNEKEGTTLFMSLLAIFKILLFRYTQQNDFAVGTYIANRQRMELEPLIGFFINTLVIRSSVRHDLTFRQFLSSIKEVSLKAFEYQDFPFEKLVEELQPEREINRNPLVQVIFQLLNVPDISKKKEIAKLNNAKPYTIDRQMSIFDLDLNLIETPDGITGHFEYSTELFEPATIAMMSDHFTNLIKSVIANPDQRIDQLSLLDKPALDLLLHHWNNTQQLFSDTSCIQDLFTARCRQIPEQTALIFENQQFSYARLEHRANQLAHRMIACGAGPESLVGICMERSAEMVISLLAILKTGAAWLPLDPSYPRSRIDFMIRDSRVQLLVTNNRCQPLLLPAAGPGLYILDIDDQKEDIAALPHQLTHIHNNPDHLAYVIYTSGTSGQPKGVMGTHRGLLNRFFWMWTAFPIAEGELFCQKTSLSFVDSIWEIFGPLLGGAPLVILADEVARDTHLLIDALAKYNITRIVVVPSLLNAMLDAGLDLSSQLPHLRYCFTSGEGLADELYTRFQQELKQCRIINLYGSSEVTADVTCFEGNADHRTPVVQIGKPIANTCTYILDKQLNPVPIGVPGELYVSGPNLARGYLHQSDRTAERFIPDPFGEPGSRLYKTGDLVRYHKDGNIEFIGRTDNQVKIRGFRIELQEIESVLLQHPGIKEAVVQVRVNKDEDKSIIAFIVVQQDFIKEVTMVSGSQVESETASQWQTIWNETYKESSSMSMEPGFNIIGWNSSYTGQPFSNAEMKEWVDNAVDYILELKPRNVLEIGCGTGLLLLRIAPGCSNYVGTDFSAEALQYVRNVLKTTPGQLPPIQIFEREATNVEGFAPKTFDSVVLNSVIQYFPSVEYLVEVIEKAMDVVADEGTIFIGDIRNYAQLAPFHTSVEFHTVDKELETDKFKSNILKKISLEKELLISPDFFRALPKRFPRIKQVEILMKRGSHSNELTRYRYEAILHLGKGVGQKKQIKSLHWNESLSNIAGLKLKLKEEEEDHLLVKGIPNARIEKDIFLVELLDKGDEFNTLKMMADSHKVQEEIGIDPVSLIEAGKELGYQVKIGWVKESSSGFDALFTKNGLPVPLAILESEPVPLKKWQVYANTPFNSNYKIELVPLLKEHLKNSLPEYMLPARYVLLNQIPKTPSGKLDRKNLKIPEINRATEPGSYLPPENPEEEILAKIWSQLLESEFAGRNDNFFESGGHSLLATQLISRIRTAFQVEIPLRQIFETPTLSDIAKRIIKEKQASIPVRSDVIPKSERLQPQKKNDTNLIASTRGKRDMGSSIPLSLNQLRLWFLNQLEPGGTFYNLFYLYPVKTDLNLQILEKSINTIIQRHSILRTTFISVKDGPQQVIHPELELKIGQDDLSELENPFKEEEIRRISNEEAQKPFALHELPLLRMRLIREDKNSYLLLFTIHHIIFDGISAKIFWNELLAVYTGYLANKEISLPVLTVNYSDYAVWQNNHFQGRKLKNQLVYWKKQLQGLPDLNLRLDYPRPEKLSYRGSFYQFHINKTQLNKCKLLCKQEGITLFTFFLANFQILLYRYSGQKDFAIGTYSGNRQRQEFETLIGFFVNTLILRLPLTESSSLKEHLALVKESLLKAYEHQDIPFEKLVEELQPIRNLNRTPLIQVLFQLLNATDIGPTQNNDPVAFSQFDQGTSIFDLDLNLIETPDGITGHFEYSTELFEPATIAMMSDHFTNLIKSVIANPDQRIDQLSLLDKPALDLLLHHWNNTQQLFSDTSCIQDLFTARCRQIPEQTALIFENQQFSYARLEHRANQLAHRMIACGAGPESLVGICMERSAEMVISLLAILKTGAAWLPLDPSYPRSRIDFMIRDSRVQLLVTNNRCQPLLLPAAGPGLYILDIDDQKEDIAALPHQLTHIHNNPDHLAYVIYTSGTSGQPKGVMGTHRGLLNRFFWMWTAFPIAEGELFCQKTSLSFVDSIWEIFGPLLGGAPLVILADEVARDTHLLIDALAKYNITRIVVVPSLLNAMLDAGLDLSSQLPHLRYCFTSGEGLADELYTRFQQELKQCRIINLYGSSEVTADVTCFEGNADHRTPVVQIGKPIANTCTYILDKQLNPVPIGVPGELYVSGPNLARGYLHQSDRTAERFIPDPFGEPGSRLYKTGDLVRYHKDGNIEFIGRTDNQVKIRGFRIELQEIESVLLQHPGIKEAVVQVRVNKDEDKSIIAFIVMDLEKDTGLKKIHQKDLVKKQIIEAPDYLELQSGLRKKIPEFMVPARIFLLANIPLAPNGKKDTLKLCSYDVDSIDKDAEQKYVKPTNSVEEILVAIWEKLLERKQISINDNFFHLGGHSLLATSLVAHVKEKFGIDLPLRLVFEAPQISALATRITELQSSQVNIPRIKPLTRSTRIGLAKTMNPNGREDNSTSFILKKSLRNAKSLEEKDNEQTK